MAKAKLTQSFLYILALVLMALIYMSYFAPTMMVSFTNQIWALCGW